MMGVLRSVVLACLVLGGLAAPCWREEALAQTPPDYALDDELAQNFGSWEPLPVAAATTDRRLVESSRYASLQAAANDLTDGDWLRVSAGIYHEAFVLRASDVVVEGVGHVVLDGATAEGKAAIVNKGSSNTIRNIECRNISVRDRNGACVRQEGRNVRLEHVYFHDSEQGLLGGRQAGRVEFVDSRLERLGRDGRAHGIYVTGGELVIRDSLVLASGSEGHEVKTRAARTLIERSVIASLSAQDSRLIDVSDGGVLIVRNSILQQGPGSVNRDVIGYGLERGRHDENRIELVGNLFLLERPGRNVLLNLRESRQAELTVSDNTIIATQEPDLPGPNRFFENREEAGLSPYPALPAVGGLEPQVAD